ncbi:MAG: OPT/YSL family transporter [Planctomycetes bacterium]|nr:OPT/YSL family transporter [Planctomycetota bacterium]
MAIQHLTPEEIRTWTLQQKDRWWLENVWKGDMPQLTLRAAISGMMIGGILSLTNLYVGAKTGWTLGVGITSVILAFAMFRIMSRIGLGSEFTILENNCMQSIATAAGYMTAPMISSLAAYMMVTDRVIPLPVTMVWIVSIGLLGVFYAFPLKRRFINDEQHPFPEGRAAGIVMDALHTGDAASGLFKAKLLAITGAGAALLKILQSHPLMEKVRLAWMEIPEYLDGWLYKIQALVDRLKIGGIELRELSIRPDTDFVMMAAGGLMGIRTGVSLLIGAVINYTVLAPIMIGRGDIIPKVADGVATYGFRQITMWSLWCGVATMTTASLMAFFSKPKMLIASITQMLPSGKKAEAEEDVLKDIELPISVSAVGIPIVGALIVFLAHRFFGVSILMGAIAIPLVFIFTLIAAHSTALTSITPTGALGKLTQLTYGVLAPKNITTNLMTAGITGEVASNASNLLMDIKPGYMLGGKPRQQAIGHVLGIFAGALCAVPIFYFVFLRGNPQGLISEHYPMPAATIWKAVAEVLTEGLSNLKESARWAALIGALLGIGLELAKILTKGKFWISGVGIGLACVIPFNTCFAMFLGAFIFWLFSRGSKRTDSLVNRVMVQNQEPVCAGIIAGGAIMGIALIAIETFVLSGHQ